MLPIKSNINNSPCSPISSNCVIWQGPCVSCLDINTGDTISDIIAQLANEICSFTGSLGLSDIDFKCLVESSSTSPDPAKTLSNFLTLIIEKVCSLEELLESLEPGGGSTNPSFINISACFQQNDLNGDLITTLPVNDYVKAIGNKVCTLQTTVSNHTTTLANHETRITALENEPDGDTLPQIPGTCLFGNDNSPKELDEFVIKLEQEFCNIRTATGTSAELITASSKQCAGLNSAPKLNGSGNMSSISGWKTNVANLSDSINNMWLVICDIRAAVDGVKACCSKTCNDVVINYMANITDNGVNIRLYFSGYAIIPTGFSDCSAQGSKLTITDGLSGSYVTYINVTAASSSPDPIVINIPSTPLNPTGNYSFVLESCVTDGTLICNKAVTKQATGTALSCGIPSNVSVTIS